MRFQSNNQTGIQNPVNFQVDFDSPPPYSIIPELWTATRPDFSDAVARQSGVNYHTASVALSDNVVYYWKVRFHVGYTDPATRRVIDRGWTPFSEVWIFRTATNSGQLPPTPIESPPNQNLPPVNVTPSPTVTNPNNIVQAGLSSLLPGGTMSTQTWVIIAVVAVAVWYFFIRKK